MWKVWARGAWRRLSASADGARRLIAVRGRRDPPAWVAVLAGMALGLGLFLLAVALLAGVYVAGQFSTAIR